MKTKKTRQELEEENWELKHIDLVESESSRKMWRSLFVIFLITTLVFMIYSIKDYNDLLDIKTKLSKYQEQVPEVINGNLYIGYEDGVRVDYHQDYLNESIWYRCAKDCRVIE